MRSSKRQFHGWIHHDRIWILTTFMMTKDSRQRHSRQHSSRNGHCHPMHFEDDIRQAKNIHQDNIEVIALQQSTWMTTLLDPLHLTMAWDSRTGHQSSRDTE